uniref:Uncharacterized protein n=1 Tax=Panagrolaimus sp. JU765 TaxID=591449 RepID=A0AC34REQ6_9BILA
MEISGKKLIWLTFILFGSAFLQYQWKKTDIPQHLVGHPVKLREHFIPDTLAEELLQTLKQLGKFTANKSAFKPSGLAEDYQANPALDGKHGKLFLVPDETNTFLTLADRLDVIYHFTKYGGVDGLKENFDLLMRRMQIFENHDKNHHITKQLLSNQFLQELKDSCPKNRQLLDGFDQSITIRLPGQMTPISLDVPHFRGIINDYYPSWLLVVMAASGLYQDEFIHQSQAKITLHNWNNTKKGGNFAFFTKNEIKPLYVQPIPRNAVFFDGSKTMHATTIYKPKAHPPQLLINATNYLQFLENDDWLLFSDERPLQKYKTKDLHITFVYRARCFESEKQKEQYRTLNKENMKPVDEVIKELTQALSKQTGSSTVDLEKLSKIDLAVKLVENFVKYPLPTKALIPFNYCIIPMLFPSVQAYFNHFC